MRVPFAVGFASGLLVLGVGLSAANCSGSAKVLRTADDIAKEACVLYRALSDKPESDILKACSVRESISKTVRELADKVKSAPSSSASATQLGAGGSK